ncbi:MAG: cytochrome c biogenesis protein ResB, partial [Maioricimonas sp. JB049]
MSSTNQPEEHAVNERSTYERMMQMSRSSQPVWLKIMAPLASLKLTVVLFALSIFIVLAGTFAQVTADVWEVVDHYFRARPEQVWMDSFPWFNPTGLFVWVDFQLFMPQSFFPSRPELPEWLGIWFPKGWTIGAVMMLNLFAAHFIRFKTQARGTRMLAGLAVTAIGALVTTLVIISGSGSDGFQQEPLISYGALWGLMQVGVLGLAATTVYGALSLPAARKYERWGLWGTALALCGLLVWTFVGQGGSRFDDSSMRILYELLKGTVAGVILLIGCILLFRKRAGIVLLHGGIGLMMVSEVLVGLHAEEAQMRIEEGSASNFVEDIRSVELAFVRDLGDDNEQHTVIPQSYLSNKETISNDELPVDVEVLEYIRNADIIPLRQAPEGTEPIATAGIGTTQVAIPVRASTGTDTGGAVDMPALYVRLLDKQTGEPIETFLVSTMLDLFNLGRNPQTITLDGSEYDLRLRFKRSYKPYTITLRDIRKEDYIGTNTPRDYSSYVKLVDESRGVDREIRIWMNNPLRFAGETFYQSSYTPANAVYPGSEEWTSLQVVKNTGWMIPYVSCMIVAVGMFAQFGLTLLRFIRRRETAIVGRGAVSKKSSDSAAGNAPRFDTRTVVLSLLLVGSFGIYLARKAAPPETPPDGMNIHAFGELPVVYQGRSKPLDTLARNTLLIISDRQTFRDENDNEQPAIRWFLDAITESEAALEHRVFRIENLELLKTLGLERRHGFRYAISEFQGQIGEFEEELRAARQQNKEELTFYQRKVIDFGTKLQNYLRMREAFVPPDLPALPSQEEMQTDRNAAMLKLQQVARVAMRESQRLEQAGIPLTIPVEAEDEAQAGPNGKWSPFSVAVLRAYLQTQLLGETPPDEVLQFNNILSTYASGDASDFNKAVAKYHKTLSQSDHAGLDLKKVRFEQFFNQFAPFYHCAAWYLIVFVLSCLAWLVWPKPLNRAALWLTVAAFLVHTFALGARIY